MIGSIKIIAHRGNGPTSLLSGNGGAVPPEFAPENTIKAFRRAVSQDVDGIEFDTYITKDGEVVVIHDDELNKNVEGANRKATDFGLIADKTLTEISEYNVGQGERAPSLQETLDYFVQANDERALAGKPPLIINIELKGDNTWNKVPDVVRPYIETGLLRAEDIVFCSFNRDNLAALKKEHPDFKIAPCLRTAALFGKENLVMPGWSIKEGAEYNPSGLEELRQFHRDNQCAAFDPVLWDVYAPLIELARQEGVELHVSTSDIRTFENRHIYAIVAIAAAGVDVHFKTDEPALARNLLNDLRQQYETSQASSLAISQMRTLTIGEEPSLTDDPTLEIFVPLKRPMNRPLPYSNMALQGGAKAAPS